MNPNVPEGLILNLPGYEGPLEVLLELAKAQKVDLAEISILSLVDQYLAFIATAKRSNLELAAAYLVMAAALAYLKSCLLLPPSQGDEDIQNPEAVAAALARRLKRLQAMKDAGMQLLALPHLGRERFATTRQAEGGVIYRIQYRARLYDFFRAYAGVKRRREASILTVKKLHVFKLEDALSRVQRLLNFKIPRWTRLQDFLPKDQDLEMTRSALASTLLAGLELSKQGKLELRQNQAFGPLYLRAIKG